MKSRRLSDDDFAINESVRRKAKGKRKRKKQSHVLKEKRWTQWKKSEHAGTNLTFYRSRDDKRVCMTRGHTFIRCKVYSHTTTHHIPLDKSFHISCFVRFLCTNFFFHGFSKILRYSREKRCKGEKALTISST